VHATVPLHFFRPPTGRRGGWKGGRYIGGAVEHDLQVGLTRRALIAPAAAPIEDRVSAR
jgi:hypothetical protein